MATLIKLTHASTGDPVFVNADLVSCFFRDGDRTRILFVTNDDQIDVKEPAEEIAAALGYRSA